MPNNAKSATKRLYTTEHGIDASLKLVSLYRREFHLLLAVQRSRKFAETFRYQKAATYLDRSESESGEKPMSPLYGKTAPPPLLEAHQELDGTTDRDADLVLAALPEL